MALGIKLVYEVLDKVPWQTHKLKHMEAKKLRETKGTFEIKLWQAYIKKCLDISAVHNIRFSQI